MDTERRISMTEHDRDRHGDRTDDLPIIPAAPAVGAPVVTPRPLGEEGMDRPQDEVVEEETDRDVSPEDKTLFDPGGPEFDHSLRRRKRD